MTVTRRRFLAASGLVVAGLAVTSVLGAQKTPPLEWVSGARWTPTAPWRTRD